MNDGGEAPGTPGPSPLFIDLDHALLRTDPVQERVFIALKAPPKDLARLAASLLRGRAAFKEALVRQTAGGFRLWSFPRQPEVEDLLARATRGGRRVSWLTREDLREEPEDLEFRRLVEGAAPVGDDPGSAEGRAELLSRRHPDGFAFVGHRARDLPLWRAARERYGVNLSGAFRRRAAREGIDIVELARRGSLARALLRAMRPHQWLKNLLVFIPFALSLPLLGGREIALSVFAFACLCLLTSGTYLVNDLLDLEADRRHPRKRKRPIASGELPIAVAAGASVALIAAALVLGALASLPFAVVLACYLAMTLAYSLRLKRMAMVDVVVIAVLFTLRILAGMLLVSARPSHWLLMFSIFFFLSLAFMKREVEFDAMHRVGRDVLQGRGYAMDDRTYVLSCGLSSGMASLVIFALFITETLGTSPGNYGTPVLLWGVMALLGYWVLRMWLLTTRGLMNDDPILFAARDRTSLLLGAGSAVLVAAAQVLHL